MKLKLLILVLFHFLSLKIIAEFTHSPPGCDFRKLVNSPYFVDKTMLISEILNDCVNLLTAPPGFGKSTSIDMLKRFLEIQVDENGEPKDKKTNSNYNLFMKNDLQIAKNKTWFNEHFGTYPVILIDYSPLCGVTNFEKMLLVIKQIIKSVFLHHAYLLKNKKLWTSTNNKNDFFKYVYDNYTDSYSTSSLKALLVHGFEELSKLLYEHFNRTVFILIDSFNDFSKHLPENRTSDVFEIIDFVTHINLVSLKSNNYIYNVLIMGNVQNEEKEYPHYLFKVCVLFCRVYHKYFGMTENEIKELIPKVVNNRIGRKKLSDAFEEDAHNITTTCLNYRLWRFYGYVSTPMVYNLYSFYPLLNFLQTNYENRLLRYLDNK